MVYNFIETRDNIWILTYTDFLREDLEKSVRTPWSVRTPTG